MGTHIVSLVSTPHKEVRDSVLVSGLLFFAISVNAWHPLRSGLLAAKFAKDAKTILGPPVTGN